MVGATCDGLLEAPPGKPRGDRGEPRYGLGAVDEPNEALGDGPAPADHAGGGDRRFLEQEAGGLGRLEAKRRDVQEQRPTARGPDERPPRQAVEYHVATALELGDAVGD